ncbi:MAG: hypothetical protein GX649_18760 [Chloroflexi bacterium]|nr:hypothetical protein [Chloroflexota bacterium]
MPSDERPSSGTPMTFREMNLRVFAGEPIPHVFFQPRFEPWYAWHQTFGGLPERYRGVPVRDVYSELGCAMRYMHYYTDMPSPVVVSYSPEVPITEVERGDRRTIVYDTPYGTLTETYRHTVDDTWRKVEFPVQRPEQLRALRWLHERTEHSFSAPHFSQGSEYVGERGEPQFWVPKSPYQALAQVWMKLEDLIYALADAPAEVQATMAAIDASYDPLYEEIVASGEVRIVNFGENIHEQLLSPRYWHEYLVPFWERRAGQLHAAGIYSHVHIDGFFHNLLPFLKDLPFDGIEALTPTPQGDVALEEIAAHIGDKVLLDGLPAVLFMPPYSREELLAAVERTVALIPRLILGISDELPEGADMEGLERVRLVADWCRRHTQ